jgi:acyl-CoA synthetase (AMP-forming)/AMP-acid ligase II
VDLTTRTIPDDLARRYVRDGHWDDRSLGALLAEGLHEGAGNLFTVRSERRPYRATLGDVDDLARRVAAGLRTRGIRPGDPVAFQLPNWMEAAATFYAIAHLGAVVVPIVHFYGVKEVSYILARTRVKALVTTDRFGHVDFLANLEAMRPSLPDLEWVAVIADDPGPGDLRFTDLVADDPLTGHLPVDPSAPALIAYTSGTTADPKGVIHSHRTIGAEIRQLGAMQPPAPPALVGAPVGHGIGMLAALLLPVWRRQGVHLIDVWDPGRVLAGMLEDQLSSGQGATYFLLSLLDHPDFDPARHAPLMPWIGMGGAAVPAAVGERAEQLGIHTVRSFGSTEHPSITGCNHESPRDKRIHTDGRPLPGVEMRLVDAEGRDVAPGEPGEIWSKGPDCFMGYTVPALTDEAFRDGWFATGDIGVLDADGYLTITDRKKDVIIRGGANISPAEVEEQLARLAGVAEVAVVGAPDPRLGERPYAFVRVQPGSDAPDLDAVRAHLERSGIARQKWPESVVVVDDFPRTASGKIQKFVLRRQLRENEPS